MNYDLRNERIFSASDVAYAMGTTTQFICLQCRKGRYRGAVKIKGRWYIPASVVRLDENEQRIASDEWLKKIQRWLDLMLEGRCVRYSIVSQWGSEGPQNPCPLNDDERVAIEVDVLKVSHILLTEVFRMRHLLANERLRLGVCQTYRRRPEDAPLRWNKRGRKSAKV